MKRMSLGIIFVTVLFGASGCGSPAIVESDIIAGDWSGMWTETFQGDMGTFPVTVTLNRNDTVLGGSATAVGHDYTIAGTLTGADFNATLTMVGNPGYWIDVLGTVTGDSMTGTWADNDPPLTHLAGTYSMTR